MNVKDFDFELPQELIAQDPLEDRSGSRLLVLDKETGETKHRHFKDIIEYLNPGDCLVINDTKVIPARLFGVKKDTGAKIELLLLKRRENDIWETLVKPGKKAKPGTVIDFGDGLLTGTVLETVDDGNRLIQFSYEGIFEEILDQLGQMPLPPYITHELKDKNRYQTVYAKHEGSAAAPTAGLHFTRNILSVLEKQGVHIDELTLHVGAGTFRPVKAERIGGHDMHTEHIVISRKLVDDLSRKQGEVIAVGTTSVRTLESLYWMGVKRLMGEEEFYSLSQWEAYTLPVGYSLQEAMAALVDWFDRSGEELLKARTTIIIVPGYRFQVIDAMFTNFHQPQSTLLLLVGAAVGEDWRKIYAYALSHHFRFLSYGDSSFLKVRK